MKPGSRVKCRASRPLHDMHRKHPLEAREQRENDGVGTRATRAAPPPRTSVAALAPAASSSALCATQAERAAASSRKESLAAAASAAASRRPTAPSASAREAWPGG